jgi:hypothetical protein
MRKIEMKNEIQNDRDEIFYNLKNKGKGKCIKSLLSAAIILSMSCQDIFGDGKPDWTVENGIILYPNEIVPTSGESASFGYNLSQRMKELITNPAHGVSASIPENSTGNILGYYTNAGSVVLLSSGNCLPGAHAMKDKLFTELKAGIGAEEVNVQVVNPAEVITYVGVVAGKENEKLTDLYGVEDLTEEDRIGRVTDLMIAYAEKVYSGIGNRAKGYLGKHSVDVTRIAGYFAFKHIVAKLKNDMNGKKAILSMIKATNNSTSVAAIYGEIKRLINLANNTQHWNLDKEYVNAACNWWKFATHTEAQLAAIQSSNAKRLDDNFELAPKAERQYASLAVPCKSCRLIPWVDDQCSSFWFCKIDNDTEEDLNLRGLTLNAEGMYNWKTIKTALAIETK